MDTRRAPRWCRPSTSAPVPWDMIAMRQAQAMMSTCASASSALARPASADMAANSFVSTVFIRMRMAWNVN